MLHLTPCSGELLQEKGFSGPCAPQWTFCTGTACLKLRFLLAAQSSSLYKWSLLSCNLWIKWHKLDTSFFIPVCPQTGVYLTPLNKDQADVCWDPISTFNLHDVTHHQLLCRHFLLLCISDDKSLLWDKRTRVQPILHPPCPPCFHQHFTRHEICPCAESRYKTCVPPTPCWALLRGWISLLLVPVIYQHNSFLPYLLNSM